MVIDAQTQGVFAYISIAALALLEAEIERRGLQEAYIRELCPWYHSFEPASIEELWALLHETPARRFEVGSKVLTNA